MSVQCCVLAATIGGSMLHAWGTLVVQTTALAQDPPQLHGQGQRAF